MYRKDYPKDPVEQPGEEVLEARCIGVRLLCVWKLQVQGFLLGPHHKDMIS